MPTGLSPTMVNLSRLFCFILPFKWPVPRSLATTSGVSVDVLSSGYLDVSVHQVRLATLCIQVEIALRRGCPIRKSSDQGIFAPPRSLSQRITSFIASFCQGIHQMLLVCLILIRKQVLVRTVLFPYSHSGSECFRDDLEYHAADLFCSIRCFVESLYRVRDRILSCPSE